MTNQSVEALPGVAGVRWYEIRRTGGNVLGLPAGNLRAQRWRASLDGQHRPERGRGHGPRLQRGQRDDVFPESAIRAGSPVIRSGQMTLGEGVVINGSGVQTTTNSRWGDYTDMTVDPTDDCTFWYVNEYYTAAGQASSAAGWQTRIGRFKYPGCVARH